jgi:hypothetical protein
MKKLYTGLRFNNKNYSDLLNVSLENDMPEENLRGNREIIEDQIPGRDIPYFYEVKDEPLEFDVVFALKKPMTKAAIRQIVQEFLSPRTYKELEFGIYEQEIQDLFQNATFVRAHSAAKFTEAIFNTDGTKLFMPTFGTNSSYARRIRTYYLSVPFDLTSFNTYNEAGLVTSDDDFFNYDSETGNYFFANVQGLRFNNDGTRLFTITSNANLVQVDLNAAWTVNNDSTIDVTKISRTISILDRAYDLTFSLDGTKLFILSHNINDNQPSCIITCILDSAWDISVINDYQYLYIEHLESIPTGFDFTKNGKFLFVTGVANKKINIFELSTAWDLNTAILLPISFDLPNGYVQGLSIIDQKYIDADSSIEEYGNIIILFSAHNEIVDINDQILKYSYIINKETEGLAPTYNIIFTDEPIIAYTGSNIIDKYYGYFTLHARCDRPYGYEKVEITYNELKETYVDSVDPKVHNISIINPGFLPVKPNIIIKNGPSARSPFRIFNYTNNTSMTFDNFAVHELINYNADLKTFNNSSTYTKWYRDELILEPGNNFLMFQFTNSFTMIGIFYANIKFEAPRII